MRALILTLLLSGCDVADTNANTPIAADYGGASWTAQLNPDGTSRVLHFSSGDTADFLVNGSDVSEGNGFTYITAVTTAGNAPTTPATAVEDPGVFFTVDYADTTTPIAMLAAACPTSAWSGMLVPLTGGMPSAFAYDPSAGNCSDGMDAYVTGEQLWLTSSLALVQSAPGASDLAIGIASPSNDASGDWAGTYYDGAHSQAVQLHNGVLTSLAGTMIEMPTSCERGTTVMACTDGAHTLVVAEKGAPD